MRSGTAISAHHDDRKIRNARGRTVDRRLLAAGEGFHAFGDVEVEHLVGDAAGLVEVGLAVQALDQRLGEGAVAPGRVLERELATGAGGEHHHAVLGGGEFVHHASDIARYRPPPAHDVAGVAGIDEEQRLASERAERVL